jgi:hypothetical protein
MYSNETLDIQNNLMHNKMYYFFFGIAKMYFKLLSTIYVLHWSKKIIIYVLHVFFFSSICIYLESPISIIIGDSNNIFQIRNIKLTKTQYFIYTRWQS